MLRDGLQIEIPTYGTGNDYNYVTATVDLNAYTGKKNKQIAFRYIRVPLMVLLFWQIDEVKVVADGEGGGTVEPEPERNPVKEPFCSLKDSERLKKGNHWPSVDAT